jgi:hypothetical protein
MKKWKWRCEWLRMQDVDFYREGILKLVPKRGRSINMLGDYVEK